MDLFKIILCSLAILSISESVSSRSVDVLGRSNRDKACVCIPSNPDSVRVPEHFSPDGKDKQQALPHLTIDHGGRLDHVNNPDIHQLFNTYPDISNLVGDVRKPNLAFNPLSFGHHTNSFPGAFKVDPILQFNFGEVLNLKPNNKLHVPFDIESIKFNDYSNDPGKTNQIPEKHTYGVTNNNEFDNILRPIGSPGNVPHVKSFIHFNIPKHLNLLQDTSLSLTGSGNSQLAEQTFSDPTLDEDDIQSADIIAGHNSNIPNENGIDKQNIPTISKKKMVSHRPLVVQQLLDNTMSTSYGPDQILLSHPKPYPHDILMLPPQPLDTALILPNRAQPKLNKWIRDQMRRLEMKKPSIKNLINADKLLKLVLNTLHQNGIKILASGDLQDANGNILPLADIQLHLILLADPAVHHKIIGANKCYIPYDAPYLEAILVTSFYSSRTLGVIPIGKTKLSEKIYYVNSDCKLDSCEHSPCCKKWPCHKTVTNAKLDENMETSRSIIKLDTKPIFNFSPSVHNLFGNFMKSRRMNDDTVTETNFPTDTIIEKTEQHPSAEEVEDENLPTGLEEQVEEVTENVEDVKQIEIKSDDEDDKDSLGIRIIGGSPAISSGTPMNIKGRTGI